MAAISSARCADSVNDDTRPPNARAMASGTATGNSGGRRAMLSRSCESSSSASGLPAVARCRATAFSGADVRPCRLAINARAASIPTPVSSSLGRSAVLRMASGSGRRKTSSAIGSATRRRATKRMVSAVAGSSRCASSMSSSSGRSSADRLNRLSVATPTANRSGAGPLRSVRATSSASRNCGGRWSSNPRTGSRSWCRPENPRPASNSLPEARSTCISSAVRTESSSSAVLPIPASPEMTSTPLCRTRAPATSVAIRCCSGSRPTSIDRS